MPGLVLDGERILGSRRIVRALEAKVPDPPLLPADAKQRKSVELAEEWGDEVLQPLVRRAIWAALRRSAGGDPLLQRGLEAPGPGAPRTAQRPAGRASPSSASTRRPT